MITEETTPCPAADQNPTAGIATAHLDPKAIIGQTLAFLHPDGAVFELCVIGPKPSKSQWWQGFAGGKKPIVAGWFRVHDKAADLAERVWATGVHVTLNPANEALLSRANERLVAGVGRTKDTEISRIRNLLIDIDPIRPEGISSTDAEHEAALEMSQIILADLTQDGCSEPLMGDSGNGAHLIFPLDLPNAQENIDLVKAVLETLSLRYQEHLARLNLELDQAVFNPARLTKLYGTWARKGDNTPDRPHRLSRIISLPKARNPVSIELLQKLAGVAGKQELPRTGTKAPSKGKLDVEAYLSRYGKEVVRVKPHGDGILYCLAECIFDSTHADNDAAIGQQADGLLYYQCFHDSCHGRTWAEARTKISGPDNLTHFIIGGTHSQNSTQKQSTQEGESKPPGTPPPTAPQTNSPWAVAAQLFPRIPFPWDALPPDIADSLQKLGRACATSSIALPGAAFCLMSSLMGRKLAVSPKEGWDSPMIIWHLDIRESGDGKTPPVRLMAGPIHDAQKEEEERYKEEIEAYNQLSKQNQDKQPTPAPPRGYFVTDLTIEGLREDLVHSPHGGIVVIQDEISAFLSGQNQYKSKGTDREAWLSLHDGYPTRVRRVGRSLYINGARVSIFGGIQPKVFRTFFAGEDGLYLSDGTLFRFLATCEPSTYYDLTAESWADRDRDNWETLLHRAINWVDGEIHARGGKIEQPTRIILSSEAQGRFLEWRNQLYSFKDRLPALLRGFLPKAVEYVLRLTGVIHCMQQFSIGKTPQAILTEGDLDRGIKTVNFYMGQIQGAIRLIEEESYSPPEISERSLLLAQTLDQLRPHLENGRLAIGFTHKHYNLVAPETQKIGKPRGMGAVLRAVKLTIPPGKHDANGHRSAKCLEWDTQTETFIKQCLQCLQSQKNQNRQGLEGADVEELMSASSAAPSEGFEDMPDISERMSASETCTSNASKDNGGKEDIMEVVI
jgi:hypothetical protein